MESSSQTTVCFSHPNRTLVIMAKAPNPGMVKTRLTESLPSPAVTALYRCLLEDTLALAESLTSVEVAVMCPEPQQDSPLFFDTSLPPAGSASSPSIATVHTSLRRF